MVLYENNIKYITFITSNLIKTPSISSFFSFIYLNEHQVCCKIVSNVRNMTLKIMLKL